jgi:transcriptional regulator with XRE-family HTH domain
MSPVESFKQGGEQALAELGRRLAGRRLERNWTQEALAQEAGVSVSTVKRLEAGHSTQLHNLVRVLCALGLAANLAALVPEPGVRPLERLEREGRRRRRATGGPREEPAEGPGTWRWGEEAADPDGGERS